MENNLKKNSRQDTIEKYIFEDEDQFTQLLNIPLQKIKDPFALAIYCYLMSLPPNWKIIPASIANHFHMGIGSVRKKLKVLIELGYMFYGQESERGRFGRGKYLIFQRALTSERRERIQKMFPNVKKQHAVEPHAVKRNNTKEIDIQKKETTTQPPKSEPAKPVPIPDPGPTPSAPALLSPFLSKQENKILEGESLEAKKAYHEFCEAKLKPVARSYPAERTKCAQEGWWKNAPPSTQDLKETHERLARWIVKNYKGEANVTLGYKYLEFSHGQAYSRLEFGQKDFEGICNQYLSRVGLSTDMLEE